MQFLSLPSSRLLLLFLLLTGHLILHVLGKGPHGFFANLAVFELSIFVADLRHLFPNGILLLPLSSQQGILLIFYSLLVHLCYGHGHFGGDGLSLTIFISIITLHERIEFLF